MIRYLFERLENNKNAIFLHYHSKLHSASVGLRTGSILDSAMVLSTVCDNRTYLNDDRWFSLRAIFCAFPTTNP